MDTKKAPLVQKVVVAREGKKYMVQGQRSELRKQVEEAIDLKLEEKVVPRFDMIDSELVNIGSRVTGIESDLKEIKNTLKLLVPKP